MKRLSIFLALTLLAMPAIVRAQDAATEERFNKLAAQIEVLVEAKDAQNKKIDDLVKAMDALQQKMNQPSPNYASQEDLKLLADKLREVDRKRQDDNDRILEGIKRELKSFAVKPAAPKPVTSDTTPLPDKGFEYVVKSGDTLSAIVAAYRDSNIKVSMEQILKANPGLKPEKMSVGQKIFIPAP